jgi:ABC-type lipoprotein release transport system permease subunit
MNFYLKLAARNLGRHGKRTLITASAIAVGLAAYLFMDSMLQGADAESEINLIRYETGGLRVYSPEGAAIRQRLSLKAPLERSADALAALAGAGLAATGRISFLAELSVSHPESGETVSETIRASAIDPETDQRVFPRTGVAVEGRWFAAGEEGLVLGRWLADSLGIKPGMPVVLATHTRAGSYQVLDLNVSGIIDSPNPNINRLAAFLPLAVADSQLEMGGARTDLAVALEPGGDSAGARRRAADALAAAGIAATVIDWREAAGDFLAMSGAKQKSSSTIIFLVFIIAAVGISNTLLMAFYERKTEIGMLRAIGMDDRALFWTFILEAAGIGLIGSAVGLCLGGLAVAWLVSCGIDFTAIMKDMDIGYRISGVFRGIWVPRSFVSALALGLLLPALTAVLPTRRALRLPITESLRRDA